MNNKTMKLQIQTTVKCGEIYRNGPEMFTFVCDYCGEILIYMNQICTHIEAHFIASRSKITAQPIRFVEPETTEKVDTDKLSTNDSFSFKREITFNLQPTTEETSEESIPESKVDLSELTSDAVIEEYKTDFKLLPTIDSVDSDQEVKFDIKHQQQSPMLVHDEPEPRIVPSVCGERRTERESKSSTTSPVPTSYKITKAKKQGKIKHRLPDDEKPSETAAKQRRKTRRDEMNKCQVECDVCGRRTRKDGMLAHLESHSSNLKYECPTCHKRFNTRLKFRNHKYEYCFKKEFPCHICGRLYTKNALIAHTRAHTGEKPFSCTVCDKRFANTSGLKLHINIHTGEKFNCTKCELTFSQPSSLRFHLTRQHGENLLQKNGKTYKKRIFKCLICERVFSHNSSLHAHKSLHTGERPFKCDICAMAFRRKLHLKNHRLLHDEKRGFKCRHCDEYFRQPATRYSHERRMHKTV